MGPPSTHPPFYCMAKLQNVQLHLISLVTSAGDQFTVMLFQFLNACAGATGYWSVIIGLKTTFPVRSSLKLILEVARHIQWLTIILIMSVENSGGTYYYQNYQICISWQSKQYVKRKNICQAPRTNCNECKHSILRGFYIE